MLKISPSLTDRLRTATKTQTLRVEVTSGGCSGMRYIFIPDARVEAEDIVIENEGVRVIVDTTSIEFLHDATLDWVEKLGGSMIVVTNPNMRARCGCGLSFSPD